MSITRTEPEFVRRTLHDGGVWLVSGSEIVADVDAAKHPALQGKRKADAKQGTIAYSILKAHNTSGDMEGRKLKFDAMASHDITLVSVIL